MVCVYGTSNVSSSSAFIDDVETHLFENHNRSKDFRDFTQCLNKIETYLHCTCIPHLYLHSHRILVRFNVTECIFYYRNASYSRIMLKIARLFVLAAIDLFSHFIHHPTHT